MTPVAFSPEQEDALQEVINVGMGQGGAALGTVLDAYVALSVPQVRIVSAGEVANEVEAMMARLPETDPSEVAAVRQAFFSSLRGESIAFFGARGCDALADLMGHDTPAREDALNEELLMEVSNILAGAVVNGVAEQLATEFAFSAPTFMSRDQSLRNLLTPETVGWRHALLVEVSFRVQERDFACHLVLLMPEDSLERLRSDLDRMLESL